MPLADKKDSNDSWVLGHWIPFCSGWNLLGDEQGGSAAAAGAGV